MIRPAMLVLAILLRTQAGTILPVEDRFQDALERERVAAESAVASGDHAKAAHHFQLRGMLFCDKGWYPAARADLRSAVREAVAGKARKIELEASVHLGQAERWSGLPAEALEQEELVLSMLGPDDPPELTCLALQFAGDACFNLNRDEEFLSYFERMLEKAQGASLEKEVAVAWAKMGLAHMNLGEASRAEECLTEAENAAAGARDVVTTASVRRYRAKYLQMLGRHAEAAVMLESLLDADSSGTRRLDDLGDLGLEYLALGRVEEARHLFQAAKELSQTLGLASFEAKLLLCFGELDISSGDLDVARRKLEEARDLLHQPHEAKLRGEVLLSLARVLELQGHPSAFDVYSEALGIGRDICDRSLESKASSCVASCYFSTNAVDLARSHLVEAKSTAELSTDVEPAAKASGTLAWLEWTQDRPAAAAIMARESFRLYRLLGMDWQALEVLDTLALASMTSGDEESLDDSVDLARGIFDSDFLRSSDLEECARLRAQFAIWAEHQQALASLQLGHPGLEEPERARILEKGFTQAGEWKARALLGGLTQRRTLPRTVERTAALAKLDEAEREILGIRSRIASAHRTEASPDVVQSLVATAEAIRLESDELASSVRKEEAAAGAALAPSATNLDDVRRALDDDRTVLVEYVAGAGKLQAYVLTRSRLELVDLGDREPIERRVAELQQGLGLKKPASTSAILEAAEAVYEDLLAAPLRPFAKEAIDQLVIVPTAALSALPFEALIVPSAAKRERPARFADADFLVRRYAVTYAPSAAVLVELAALEKHSAPSAVLMMVDPAYPAIQEPSTAGVNLMGKGFARLIASRVEGSLVARVLGGSTDLAVDEFASDGLQSISAKGYLLLGGSESTPARFLAEAPKHSVIHVAAHGIADFEDPDQGALALTPSGSSDGLLTYRDVMRLPLAADLAVLSACDTGVGRPLAGEGILSLARAFMLAGSRSVVASLWPVDDRQTGETMGLFYRHYLAEGATIPRALRQAKLEVIAAPRIDSGDPRGVLAGARKSSTARLTESADPWFWAPFVCVGPVR